MDCGASEEEFDALSQEAISEIMDGFSTSEGNALWICNKEHPHQRVRLEDGRLIASNEIEAPKVQLDDPGFNFLVPTAERTLCDLRSICEPKESFSIVRQPGVFILETSIGLASWNDALSRKIHDHGVTLTRFEPLKSPVVHEFWLAWDGWCAS